MSHCKELFDSILSTGFSHGWQCTLEPVSPIGASNVSYRRYYISKGHAELTWTVHAPIGTLRMEYRRECMSKNHEELASDGVRAYQNDPLPACRTSTRCYDIALRRRVMTARRRLSVRSHLSLDATRIPTTHARNCSVRWNPPGRNQSLHMEALERALD